MLAEARFSLSASLHAAGSLLLLFLLVGNKPVAPKGAGCKQLRLGIDSELLLGLAQLFPGSPSELSSIKNNQ